jgi:transposase
MKKRRNKYSLDFKLKALELLNQRGDLSLVANELNISPETLKNWHKGRNLNEETVKAKTQEDEELARLRKELHETRLERDILKKAVGIFSKSDR